MSILEILEDHRQHDAVAKDTRFYCLCGWVPEMPRYGYGPAEHRAHVAQVLEEHEREAKAEALEEAARSTPVRWDYPPHASALEIRPWLRDRAAELK